MPNNGSPTAISLFTGAGGMDVGFRAAGFSVVWANDIDDTACETYRRNHRSEIAAGPLETHLSELKKLEGADLLFGGPPCQGFSVAGKMNPHDARSQLIWKFFDAVEIVKPRAFVCENVKALAVLTRWRSVRQQIFARVAAMGYDVRLVILNSRHFGVSQSRERMFLIGLRDEELPESLDERFRRHMTTAPTVRTVLSPLGPAGSPGNTRVCKASVTMAAKPVLRRSAYAGMLFNGQGRPINPDGYSATLHASMGGNKTPIIDEEHLHNNKPSWVEEYHRHLLNGGKPLPFDAAPPRLRRLTVDEAILLQTFQANYDFAGKQGQIFTQVGNAVPCKLAEAVARVTAELLEGESEEERNGRCTLSERPQIELAFSRLAAAGG